MDVVYGKWESEDYDECDEALSLVKKWSCVKEHHPNMGNIKDCLYRRISEIQCGNLSCLTGQYENADD